MTERNLRVGGVYDLYSRNLLTGVWTGSKFIGIRRKFDSLYLDSETATVRHVGDRLGIVPKVVPLEEGFRREDEAGKGYWETNWVLACILMCYPHPEGGEWVYLEDDEYEEAHGE